MTAEGQNGDGSGNRSAERVLRILELVGASPPGATAAEIAATLGLNLSTTYRLLGTLARQDYIGRQAGDHRYILGRTVDTLGRALRYQLVATPAVRAVLRDVYTAAHAPAYLTVFRGDDIAVAHIEDSPGYPRIGQLHVGFAEASHATAFGKLMLAAKDDVGVARFLERHSPLALTSHSVTDATVLREQLGAGPGRSPRRSNEAGLRPATQTNISTKPSTAAASPVPSRMSPVSRSPLPSISGAWVRQCEGVRELNQSGTSCPGESRWVSWVVAGHSCTSPSWSNQRMTVPGSDAAITPSAGIHRPLIPRTNAPAR